MAGAKKSDSAHHTYEVGDIVLAKVKGYPLWPARVIDPETAPPSVKKDRPKGTKTTFYCVCFFPTGDHAWQVTSGMQKLQKHEIEAYISEPHKKNGDLLTGYQIALDPTEWDTNRTEALKKLEEEAKDAPIDELDEDVDGEKSTSKKRKRESEGGDKKTPAKKSTPAKAVKPKADAATPKPSKKRGKKGGAISAPTIAESEDESAEKKDNERPSKKSKGDEDDEDEESMSEEAKLVKSWRHELQRIFLNKNSVIKAEDMEKASSSLKTIEEFGSKMTLALLSSSKLGKVIKKMTALGPDAIPNNDEFKIAERSNALLGEWSKLASTGTNGDAVPAPSSEPAVNGDAKMDVDAPASPAAAETAAPAEAAPTVDAEADVEMKDPTPAPAPTSAPATEPVAAAEPIAEPESAPVAPTVEPTTEAPVPAAV